MDSGFPEPRPVCSRCRRPARACYCAHLPRIETKTRIVILQHPRERDVPVGTAHMASLCLPSAELHVATSVAEAPALERVLADPARPAILLSPGEGARDLVTEAPRVPVTLVVVDGTWSQAKKIVKNDPVLQKLPRYAFVPHAPSEYRIRREPEETFVSTIEALVYTLGALEGDPARFMALLDPFRAMVEFQLDHARRKMSTRVRRPRAPKPPRPRLPALVTERARDLVCVVGEANAWPYRSPERDRYDEELVHWAAVRVATGERFEAVIAPRHPLAPGTPSHVELEEPRLRDGVGLDELAARWREFQRPSDVIASWGTYATKLFDAAGIALSRPRIDLREAGRMWARGKVGTIDDFLVAVDRNAPEPAVAGRAGRRLAALEAIAKFMTGPAAGPGVE